MKLLPPSDAVSLEEALGAYRWHSHRYRLSGHYGCVRAGLMHVLRQLTSLTLTRHRVKKHGLRLARRFGLVPTQRTDFASLSESPPDSQVPPLDRSHVDLTRTSALQRQWREEGVVHLPGFLPEALMQDYIKVRAQHPEPGGWECPVPYMHVPQLRDLVCYKPLADVLQSLLGEPMGVHLNLTGWVTTAREWHQDDYLNPEFINSWYAAVWMALDNIHPDCGPFEYVPGSHRWPVMRQERVKAALTAEEARDIGWCAIAERFVTPAYEKEIIRSGLPVRTFLGKRGDVLIWHGRLVHRGSPAKQPGMPRKALIAHYSAIRKRIDMPDVAHTPDGVPYFVVNDYPLDFRAKAS